LTNARDVQQNPGTNTTAGLDASPAEYVQISVPSAEVIKRTESSICCRNIGEVFFADLVGEGDRIRILDKARSACYKGLSRVSQAIL
jgi:hypothetical protein